MLSRSFRTGAIAAILSWISACASTQINSNTFDIARTYDSLITKQVTFNLMKYVNDPYSLPAVVKVSNQTATTTNSVTPTFTVPLTTTIARAATRTITSTGDSASIGANNQWSQTYTLAPVYDPDLLRRLRTIYQYATRFINDNLFEVLYPIIETSGGGGNASGSGQQIKLSITVDNKPVSVVVGQGAPENKNKIIYVRRAFIKRAENDFILSYEIVNPDLTFIKAPGCIMCDYGNGLSVTEAAGIRDPQILSNLSRVHKLEKSVQLTQDWLYLPGQERGENAIPLPSDIGEGTLFVDGKEGLAKFYEFALFSQEASVQGTGSPVSSGQSDGRKTAPSQNINIPVSGASTIVP